MPFTPKKDGSSCRAGTRIIGELKETKAYRIKDGNRHEFIFPHKRYDAIIKRLQILMYGPFCTWRNILQIL
jgi:hypothetical protein